MSTFGPASELPYRRRTSDWVRLATAAAALTAAAVHEGHPSGFEQGIAEAFESLPGALHSLFELLYRLGALWAVGLVGGAALLARRWRLARDLLLAGAAAWIVARLLGGLVVTDASLGDAVDATFRFGRDAPRFPVTRLAVVTGVISTATPYLSRPARRVGWLFVGALAFSSLYLGLGLPNDAFGAVVLGWGIAAAIHLTFGSPGGRPTRKQVHLALAELGVDAHDVELCPVQPVSGTAMTARDQRGPLEIRVLGRDERDAQFLAKWWRVVLYRDRGPRLHVGRLAEIEHEAYVLLLAARGGVRVPDVVVAGTAGPGAALLGTRPRAGTALATADAAQCTDAVLADVWAQVAALHDQGVVHNRCNAHHVVLTADGAALDGFEFAATSVPLDGQHADVAELLVSTAAVVGDDRAIAAAIDGLGPDAVGDALAMLQPAAFSPETRPKRGERKALRARLDTLRQKAAAALGVEVPELEQLHRFKAANVMMAVGTLVAIFALLSQIGDPAEFWETLKGADFRFLVLAFALSMSTNVAYAIAMMGASPVHIGMWRTTELQNATVFANLAVPAVGGVAVQTRYLQKQGVPLGTAAATSGLLLVTGVAVQLPIFVLAAVLSPGSVDVGDIPIDEIWTLLAIVIGVVALAGGLLFGIPRIRNAVVPKIREALGALGELFRNPRRFGLLLAGQASNALIFGADLMICVHAFGGSIDYFTVLAINIGVSAIASLIPVPGGPTAVGAVGLSGALVAAGVPTEVAVAAVLANQLVNNFVPAVPGWVATRDLLAHDFL